MAQRIVGLDIGTSAVRAVELLLDDGPPVVEAVGQVGLPRGAVHDGEVQDRSQVVAALRRLWREGGFRERHVHLGIAGTRTITREIDLPPVPSEELEAAVRLQADEVIPFPMDETVTSSAVIDQTTDSEGLPRLRVLVAAAHHDAVESVVDAVQEAGLEPVGIDLNSTALARAFDDPSRPDDVDAIVSVGAGLTMVVVHRAGVLLFVRTIGLGGDAVTDGVAAALDRPLVDAEEMKRHLSGPGVHDERARTVTAAIVDDLVTEIQNSIRYFASLPGRTAPSRVLLTGGGSHTAGLLAKLRRNVDVPVELASPLSAVDLGRLPVSPDEMAALGPTVGVTLGLALAGREGTRFNLLPKEVAVRRTLRRVQRALVVGGVVLLLLLCGGTAWRVLAVRSAEHNVSSLTSRLHYINTVEIPRYDKAVKLTDRVTSLQHQLLPLVAKEVDWLVALNQIGQYEPSSAVMSGMRFTSVTTPLNASSSSKASAGSAVIGTGSTAVTVGTLTQVTQFGLAMAKAPGLTRVVLSGGVSAGGTRVTFPVDFQITSGALGQRQSLFTQKVP